jgi:LacI family transcriptional regulator
MNKLGMFSVVHQDEVTLMTQLTRRHKVVNIRDVANRALGSVGTVSRSLNNRPGVESDLRERVMVAARELGYQLPKRAAPHPHHASYLNPFDLYQAVPEISHVAFCCRPVISPLRGGEQDPYFPLVLRGVEAECRQYGLHLIYRIIEDEGRALEQGRKMLLESHTDALLLINFVDRKLVGGLTAMGLPAVLVDHLFPDLPLDTVSNDNYSGGISAVRHLIKRGHRRIGFVNGLPHITVQQRFEGYRRALEEAGIPFDPAHVLPGDLTLNGGLAAAKTVAERGLDCTAYFCSNDWSAFGFIQGLRAQGLRVPEDVSIVGFDDAETSKLISPALTTIRADPVGVGRTAVRKLIERVKFPNLPTNQTLLYTELIERDSVRSLR